MAAIISGRVEPTEWMVVMSWLVTLGWTCSDLHQTHGSVSYETCTYHKLLQTYTKTCTYACMHTHMYIYIVMRQNSSVGECLIKYKPRLIVSQVQIWAGDSQIRFSQCCSVLPGVCRDITSRIIWQLRSWCCLFTGLLKTKLAPQIASFWVESAYLRLLMRCSLTSLLSLDNIMSWHNIQGYMKITL